MSDLLSFLCENPVADLTKEVKASDRIPHNFKIKAMTMDDFKTIENRCAIKDRKGMKIDTDRSKMLIQMVIDCVVEPDFASQSTLDSLGVVTPTDAVKKVLLSGEITELAMQIQTLSGFDTGFESVIEDAKN